MAESKYSVPEKVRKAKIKGSIVKNVNGRYYVYKMIYFYKENSKKRKSKTGEYLGYITDEGIFVKEKLTQFKAEKKARTQPEKEETKTINLEQEHVQTSKEFGQFSLIKEIGKDLLIDLKNVFTEEESNTIFTIASINLIKQYTHLKNFKKIYRNSYYSVCFEKVKDLSKNSVSEFLQSLGS
jgi:hypothetical protein